MALLEWLAKTGKGVLRKFVTVVAVIAILAVGVALFGGDGDDGGKQPFTSIATDIGGGSGSGSAASYVNEYGGERAVYQEILDLTDCNKLQEKFDIAASNNERETPGTPLFRVTLGYMTAADDTMEARSCYD